MASWLQNAKQGRSALSLATTRHVPGGFEQIVSNGYLRWPFLLQLATTPIR